MTEPLRAALVGLGMMGRNHARVLQTLPGVELVVVADPAGAADLRLGPSVAVVASGDAVLDHRPDLCVLAAPTALHERLALELAAAGVPTLVEKPLSHDESSATAIAEAFEKARVPACVGHIERYNPALLSLRRRLQRGDLGPVLQIATRRQGPFPARVSDVGVVLDLATHDLDLTAWVSGSRYRWVAARSRNRSGREFEDLVAVVGELEDGSVVNHLVNWLSPLKERTITVTGENGCFVGDTLSADLTFHANGSVPVEWDTIAAFRGVSEGDMTRYAIPKQEPLVAELAAFVAAVRGDESGDGVVTLHEGLDAVRVAEAVRRSAATGQAVEVAP